MKKFIIAVLLGIIFTTSYTYDIPDIYRDIDKLFEIVPETQRLKIGSDDVDINVRYLLLMTAMIESNLGRDKYNGRYAKTYLQLEEDSARHYVKIMPELTIFIENKLGRKLKFNNNKDAVYIAYILYMAKIQYHYNWIAKYQNKLYSYNQDVEWFIYKLYYNSVKGKSTYKTWKRREKQLIALMEVE